MRKLLAITAMLGLLSGCAWFGADDESNATVPAAGSEPIVQGDPQPAPEPAPRASTRKAVKETKKATATKKATGTRASKSATTSKKGAKSEAQIKAELDQMGKKLVGQSSRTLLPNKANKEVRQSGGQFVATYNQVDTNNVSTEMKPGATAGQYVGIIRYNEQIFECRGATRQAALAAPCEQARTRRMTELIHYDGHKWND